MSQINKKFLVIFLIMLATANQALAGALEIDSVNITPNQPSNLDAITFNIFGTSNATSTWVDHSQFYQYDTSLQLDLYLEAGIIPAISNWSYSKQIQPLSLATYSLEVRAFDNYSSTLLDTYNIGFAVVPEPATIFLLRLGIALAKKKLA